MDNLGHNPGSEVNGASIFGEAPRPDMAPNSPLTPERDMSQIGNTILNIGENEQAGPNMPLENVSQEIISNEEAEKTDTSQGVAVDFSINKDTIVTDNNGLSKKAIEQVARVVNDLKDDPAALEDAWYEMMEANLKNSYNREIGKVA